MLQRGSLCYAKGTDPRGRHVLSLMFTVACLARGSNDWGNNRLVGPSHREGTFWCHLWNSPQRVYAFETEGNSGPMTVVVLRLQHQQHLEALLQQMEGATSRVSDSLGVGWGLRIGISVPFPGEADAVVQIEWEPLEAENDLSCSPLLRVCCSKGVSHCQ